MTRLSRPLALAARSEPVDLIAIAHEAVQS